MPLRAEGEGKDASWCSRIQFDDGVEMRHLGKKNKGIK